MEKKEIKTTEDLKNFQAKFKGHEIIKFIAKTLPNQPGVYQMEDEEGNILYIGKAKNLSKRVINYTSLNNYDFGIPSYSNHARLKNGCEFIKDSHRVIIVPSR